MILHFQLQERNLLRLRGAHVCGAQETLGSALSIESKTSEKGKDLRTF